MIGRLDPREKKVIVIGGGIAGLLAAYFADRAGYEVTLCESADRVGGLIGTTQTSYGMAESAAHSLLVTPAVAQLFADLNVPLVGLNPSANARWILRMTRGKLKLRRFPLPILETLRTLWRIATVRALPQDDSLNLEEWGVKFLGRPAVDYLLTPMVGGIFGAKLSELSVGAAFPAFVIPVGRTLLRHLIRRKPPGPRPQMMAPRDGMGSLLSALATHLRSRLGARFQIGVTVRELPSTGNMILCTPAHQASRLLFSVAPDLAKHLSEVRYTSLTTATVFVRSQRFKKTPQGVGVLMPRKEARKVLGILFNSSAFPGRAKDGYNSYTAIFEGMRSNEEVSAAVLAEMKEGLGLLEPKAHLMVRVWENAVPQYNESLRAIWDLARHSWCASPGRVLAGNYTGQVSLRGMIETASHLELEPFQGA